MKHKLLIIICCISGCVNFALAQGVGINNPTPNITSVLDIFSTDKGVLIPRMTTANRNAISLPATGLLVFDATLNLFYYFDGLTWRPLLTSNMAWGLTGNSGTLPAANFIGSTDAQPVLFKTNSIERMRIFSSGEVAIGATVPMAMFHDSVAYSGYAGRFENSRSDGRGLLGINVNAAGTSTLCHGVVGATSQSQSFGGRFSNASTSGTGLFVAGNNSAGTYLLSGSGASINGDSVGMAVRAINTNSMVGLIASGNGMGYSYYANSGSTSSGRDFGLGAIASANLNGTGGYFTNGNGAGTFARVAYTNALGLAYKISGPGAVATSVYDLQDKKVDMFCPESPEVLFQDFGEGQLKNGSCHIRLDPVFSKNIFVDSQKPLRVYIQLNDNCNGVYVTNRSKNGFDVVEINGGNSNATFTWFVSANRIDDVDPLTGNLLSRFQNVRFPASAPRATVKTMESKTDIPGY